MAGWDPRVLLAEDDRAIRESLTLALELEGHEVEAVTDGGHALEAIMAQRTGSHRAGLDDAGRRRHERLSPDPFRRQRRPDPHADGADGDLGSGLRPGCRR